MWENITVYAKWNPIVYSVTYELDGGLLVEDNPLSYTADQTELILNSPQKEHYDFVGWYLEEDSSTMYEKIPVEACRDIKLCACWTQHPYNIEYVDGNTHTNPLTYVIKNETLELSKPKRLHIFRMV